MFTLSLIYVIFYLFIFLSILILTFSQLPIYVLTHFSTPNVMVFIQKYKPTKNLYLLLFFSLTGLPPVGLFFIKFNIFFFVLYQANFLIILVLFFFFFFNMIFYAQLFNFRNFKKPLYPLLTPNLFSLWQSSYFDKAFFSTYSTYKVVLTVVNVLFFLFLTILFFSDYFLILNIL